MAHIVCHRGAFVERKIRFADAEDLHPIPFVLVPTEYGTRIPLDIVARAKYDQNLGYMMAGLRRALEVEAEVANLSIGPPPPFDGRLDESDPLIIATKVTWERGTLPVVAAGNYGPGPGTVGHLALSPWVLSVGAVDSSGVVLPSSSRGIDESTGPDVCADGTDTYPEPAPAGTSFAAAKVSLLAAWTFAMLRWLAFAFRAEGSTPVRIFRPTVAFLDTGLRPDAAPVLADLAKQQADALHSLGFAPDVAAIDLPAYRVKQWCADVRAGLTAAGLEFEGDASPSHVRRLLCASAETATPADPAATGAGIVSEEALWRFFSSFVPSTFYKCFGESDVLTVPQQDALKRLDERLRGFWSEPEMLIAWNALYIPIDRHHVKVVAGYGQRDQSQAT